MNSAGQRIVFNECKVLHFAGNSAKDAALFLHGFPADSGKNEDVAYHLASKLNIDSFVPHYRGLGDSPGLFSFGSSFEDALNLFQAIQEKGYRSIHLVAHSWGAWVALNVLKQENRTLGKVVMLAPFCEVPDKSTITEILQGFIETRPNSRYNLDVLVNDFLNVVSLGTPLEIASNVEIAPNTLMIVSGTQDVVAPIESVRLLVAKFKSKPYFIETEDDHWFSERSALTNTVHSWLAR